MHEKQITVIGAGIAGLVAAHELEKLGHDVRVVEGRLDLGGRVRTHQFSTGAAGPLAELGAMRIPAGHHRTLQWITELGLADRVRPFKTLFSDDATYLETSIGHLRVRDASRALVDEFSLGLPTSRYSEETVLFGAWLAASVNAIAPGNFRKSLRDDLNVELLDLIEGIDLTPYVHSGPHGRVDLNAFFADHSAVGDSSTGQLQRFFDDIAVEASSALFRLEGGMDQIVRRLAARIRGPIMRGREVVGLDVHDDGVRVEVRRGFETVSRHCDYVLCTVPFSVLRRMRVTGLDADKVAMIHDMQYWPATKIAVHCREPFWQRDGISGGGSFSGGVVRQTYYPPVESDPAHGAVLLASYTIGSDADVLGGIHPDKRATVVLDELSAIHPELGHPGMVLDVVTQAWGEDPSSMGAACVRWGKDAATCEEERRLAAMPQGRLFFAGEHCSSYPAWIEGAFESGMSAAREMHSGVGRIHQLAGGKAS